MLNAITSPNFAATCACGCGQPIDPEQLMLPGHEPASE